MKSISSRGLGLARSNSTPAYRSSVFSRTITRSTGTSLKKRPHARVVLARAGCRRTAPTPAARWTLMLRKPVPTGVVIGAFRAQRVRRMLASDAVGQRRCPVRCHHVHARLLNVPVDLHAGGVDALRAASANSGPVPSPVISVTSCAMVRAPGRCAVAPLCQVVQCTRCACRSDYRTVYRSVAGLLQV